MKTFIRIILIITSIAFSQNVPINIGDANILNDRLEYSSTIDLKRFEQFYVPITATTFNDFGSISIAGGNGVKPPLSALRIGGELVVGNVLGLGLGYITGGVGYIFGFPLGVYAVGNIGNQTGSLTATFLGSLIGVMLGFSLSNAYFDDECDQNSDVPDFCISNIDAKMSIIAISLFSTGMFNATRKFVINRD